MTNVTLLEQVELAPVIELPPPIFASEGRPMPASQDDGEWLPYWVQSLADSGITGLSPLGPRSWKVPVRQLTDPLILERILSMQYQDLRDEGFVTDLSEMGPMYGGLALCAGEQVLLEPRCCCDLGALVDWEQAVEHRDGGWAVLWIGHPWISIRYQEEWLILSGPSETGPPTDRWVLRPDVLRSAIAAGRAELEDFARRLEPIVRTLGGAASSVSIARQLTGLAWWL